MSSRSCTVRYEQPVGVWTHVTRSPGPLLAPLMYRELIGFDQEWASFGSWLEAPRPALTLMIDLRGEIRENGQRLPDAWFCGLSDAPTMVEFDGSYASLDLEFNPLGAYRVLGVPLSELKGRVVALDELFGRRGAELAEEVGCSRRYLAARFGAEVGLSPKGVARLIRFEHVCRRLRAAPARWADIAAAAGFSDQPHLNREFRDLAGTTPTDFLARCIPDGGVVGDEVAVA